MKKIAIAGAILALSTSALAGDMYIRVNGMGNFGHPIYKDDQVLLAESSVQGDALTVKKDDNKFSESLSDISFGGLVGVGYKVMDNIRVEAQGGYIFETKWNKDAKTAKKTTDLKANENSSVKSKTEVDSFVGLLTAYVDFDAGPVSIYGKLGGGVSYMELKEHVDAEFVTQIDNENDDKRVIGKDDGRSGERKYEKKIRPAFTAGFGLSFELSENMMMDAGYSFTYLGKPEDTAVDSSIAADHEGGNKDNKIKKDVKWKGDSVMLHSVEAGIRFSL